LTENSKSDIPFLSAAATASAIRAKEVSSVEVVQAYLGRIDRLDATLKAYITVCREDALAALPAISVPGGFTSGNLPIGLQLGPRPFSEETLLRAAHAYEQATPWHQRLAPEAQN